MRCILEKISGTSTHIFFASFGASVDQRVANVASDYLVPILMSCLCTLLFTIRILNLQRNSAYSKGIWGQCN